MDEELLASFIMGFKKRFNRKETVTKNGPLLRYKRWVLQVGSHLVENRFVIAELVRSTWQNQNQASYKPISLSEMID